MSDGERVLVVSSDRLFRESVAVFLQQQGWSAVTVEDGLQALVAVTRAEPGVVLFLRTRDRFEDLTAIRQIKRRFPGVRVTVVGGDAVDGERSLPRTATASHVTEALAAPKRPGPQAGGDVARSEVDRERLELLATLTPSERRIMAYLVDGLAKGEIASVMGVSENTVRTHHQNLYRKLQIHSRLELIRFASLIGLSGSPNQRAD